VAHPLNPNGLPVTLMGLQHLYRIGGVGPLVLYNIF
jgi:hypothetical protein